jgi:hypothetical protein
MIYHFVKSNICFVKTNDYFVKNELIFRNYELIFRKNKLNAGKKGENVTLGLRLLVLYVLDDSIKCARQF